MHLTIQKWGNSLALRIPKTVATQVHVHRGSRMDLSVAVNKIVLTAKDIKEYSLASLLKKVTRSNLHNEISFGEIQGLEVW